MYHKQYLERYYYAKPQLNIASTVFLPPWSVADMIQIQISFLDEDEVGDRITVRSDEELKAMLSYVSICSASVSYWFAS